MKWHRRNTNVQLVDDTSIKVTIPSTADQGANPLQVNTTGRDQAALLAAAIEAGYEAGALLLPEALAAIPASTDFDTYGQSHGGHTSFASP